MKPMRTAFKYQSLGKAIVAAALFASTIAAQAATTVNLTAQRTIATMPDGTVVPMWGYCGAAVAGGAGTSTGGVCPAVAAGTLPGWAPGPTITVPAGDVLTISLTNTLPTLTSIVILGQVGGGIGAPVKAASATHAPATTTTLWSNVPVDPMNPDGPTAFKPPVQGARARSFAPEADGVQGTSTPGTQTYTWSNLKPGTYLYQSGSRPSLQVPMGLYGLLVVTGSPSAANTTTGAVAAPGVAYAATVPGTTTTVPLNYDMDGALLFSEVDPLQNAAVDAAAVSMAAAQAPFSANLAKYSALEQRNFNDATCGLPSACYPPAVNYAPTYFLVNGQSYDRTNPAASAVILPDAPVGGAPTGKVLLRLANAGLKTHIPTVVGLPVRIVAEDGNLQPDVAAGLVATATAATPTVAGKMQSEVHLAAGKTVDVLVSPPTNAGAATPSYADAGYPVFDRQLSLSGGNKPNAGMQAFVAIAPPGTTAAGLAGIVPTSGSGSIIPAAITAIAVADTFNIPAGSTTFSGNVLANDVGITGVAANGTLPTGVTLNPDGSFTYLATAPATLTTTSFQYCSTNLVTASCATVNLTVTAAGSGPTLSGAQVFTSKVATLLQQPHPGVLGLPVPGVTGSVGWTFPSGPAYSLSASATATVPAAPIPSSGATQIVPSSAPTCTGSTGASTGVPAGTGACLVTLFTDGSFTATATRPGAYTFSYYAVTPQNARTQATATIVFPTPSGVSVVLKDSATGAALPVVADTVSGKTIADYRWVIEQDDTFLHDPGNAGNVPPAFNVPIASIAPVPGSSNQVLVTYGNGTPPPFFQGFVAGTYVQVAGVPSTVYNGVFRIYNVTGGPASGTFMYTLPITPTTPLTAATGGMLTTAQSLATNFHRSHMPMVASGCTGVYSCNDGQTIGGAAGTPAPRSSPADVALDPNKRYYISILPGDAGAPAAGLSPTGHTIGGANIAGAQITAPAANGVTVALPPNPLPPGQMSFFVFEDNNPISGDVDDGERGLGGFQIVIYDTRGSSGDQAGQITYDLFNQPLTNALANTPGTGTDGNKYPNLCPTTPNGAATPVGVIYTCMPVLDQNGNDISPFTGMALVKNVIPGRIDVQAHPAAWREGAGEQWIQVSTLEGTPNNDAFVHAGEPAYWQEFGPPGFHAFIGFVNPAQLAKANAQAAAAAQATSPPTPLFSVTGRITNLHMDRPPEAKLNDSCQGAKTQTCARAALNYTQCYVALNSQSGNGPTIAFAQCDANGNFTMTNVPPDTYELFIWDEWLDQIKAKKAVVVRADLAVNGAIATGDTPVFNWFTRVQETTFLDLNGNGMRDPGEPGLVNLPQNIRFRDGSFSNRVTTDADGNAFHNELFPLFNWYVLESDQTRYKNTGMHIIYDAGGIPDQTPLAGTITSPENAAGAEYFDSTGVLNSTEKFSLPANLQIPGSKYVTGKTERIDSPNVSIFEGMQGFINQTEFLEWGKQPFAPGENGGISGMIYFASVRAFDDPRLKVQNLSEPGIPRVQVNLYKRTTNPDGTTSDVLIDTTTSSSWDDWAMGTNAAGVPNMNCPGQAPASPNAPAYTPGVTDPFINYTLGASNQYKCYDGQHSFNQVQPAPYDGYYAFPTANCDPTVCIATNVTNNGTGGHLLNPDGTDPGPIPMLPPGQYVVEVVRPAGYEITKEEDKNILIGDMWIAAAPQQFGTLQNIYILPDQATLNNNNPEGFSLPFPPCVGMPHLVPDYLTVVPEAGQVAPFAGQVRPLCDKKLVALGDQMAAGGDFQLWTSAPIAGHVSGLMLNDAAAEFDPYNPSFGEKFALPNAPVSIRDYNGVEIARAYTDKWGTFNFLNPSTWEANVPNPSGYAPNMLTYCMNDPGPVADPKNPGKFIVDPYYNPQYSDFCYNWPILPGITTYLDTPVLPISAFALSYAPVDCQYPDLTPAIKRVDGNWTPTLAQAFLPLGASLPTGPVGPYVDLAAASPQLVIQALGDTSVLNPAYAGPQALPGTTYAANRITRHYGFGATAGTVQLVTPQGAVAYTLTVPSGNWTDAQITVPVPTTVAAGEYQMVVKTSTGSSTIDTVTVTVDNHTLAGYRAPWYVAAPPPGSSGSAVGTFAPAHPIQDAIDNAGGSAHSGPTYPGDLIIVDAGLYPEHVIMWKPVRLQGVGAASSTIQATKYPANSLADWRSRINLFFGLDPEGNQLTDNAGNILPAQIDPLPGQEITGGIVRLEPSALSTEQGAGITVLAANHQADAYVLTHPKPRRPVAAGEDPRNNPTDPTCLALDLTAGVPAPTVNFWPDTPYGFYPAAGSVVPGNVVPTTANQPVASTEALRRWSDFACYSARIDGLGITGSDAGGGIYVNGWAHYLEISNNRVYGNSGPYAGGVRIGQPYLENQAVNASTGTLSYDFGVNIHNNAITTNGTDEANASPGTPVGTSGAGGGLSVCAGSDNFRVAGNWICGNFSAGDGGGVGIVGNSTPGTLSSNFILFNEAYQQTGANFGGGLAIEGEPGAPSTGVGNILVDGNLIQGNAVRSGSGGGVRLAQINGTEVTPRAHYSVTLVNNEIVNNVAGWAGAGVSIVDTLWANIEENTIANNDAVGTSGSVMNQIVAGGPANGIGPTTSIPSPSGIASEPTSPALAQVFTRAFTAAAGAQLPASQSISQPLLRNNIVYQNRSFYFDASTGTAKLCPANTWAAAAAHTCSPLPAQTATGQCVTGASYWDVGVLGDTAPTNTLAMTYSFTTAAYTGTGNRSNATGAVPGFVKAYCNGGRVQPGAQFEPGSPFQPAFGMNAAATLDESGNFVDLQFGPLSLRDPVNPGTANGNYDIVVTTGGAYNAGTPLGGAPYSHDIHGTPRPQVNRWDMGADEVPNVGVLFSVNTTSLVFGPQLLNTTSAAQSVTVTNVGTATGALGIAVSGPFARPGAGAGGTCGATLAPGASCTVNVTFHPTTPGTAANVGTLAAGGQTVALSGTGVSAAATVAPATLAFGQAVRGTVSASQTVTVTNTSSLPETLTVALGGANANQFAMVNGCAAAVPAGGTCTVSVTFVPAATTSLGAKTANLTVGVAGAAPAVTLGTVTLTGSAATVPAVNLGGTAAVNFGTGAQPATNTRTITLTNAANALPFYIAPNGIVVAKTNTGTGTYALVTGAGGGTCVAGGTIAGGASCTIVVSFSVAATSATTGTLTVSGTAQGTATPTYSVSRNLTGN
jgi:large repetitive protein